MIGGVMHYIRRGIYKGHPRDNCNGEWDMKRGRYGVMGYGILQCRISAGKIAI